MNKKITIIELIQKCANNENIPKRIVYKNTVFVLNEINNYINEEKDERLLDYILPTFANLNDEVEILEDNTEEIEELELIPQHLIENCTDRNFSYLAIKYNEISNVVNQMRKEKQ